MKQKILIISGSMVHRTPHVKMYMNIFDRLGVEYDVVVWNRKGDSTDGIYSNYILYNHKTDDQYPFWRKIIDNWRFSKFVLKKVDPNKYSAAIVIDIAAAVFFSGFLIKYFKKRFLFDIRDYSPFCRFSITQKLIKLLINSSYRTIISSAGFKSWLPKDINYVISHNIDYDTFCKLEKSDFKLLHKDKIKILMIGNLRDPEANKKVIDAFANKDNYSLDIVGDGAAGPILRKHQYDIKAMNVKFFGFYQKDHEIGFYQDADFVTCCMDDNILSNYLMSNRIYLAVLTHKPIICFAGSYQSKVIEDYGIGIAIERNADMFTSTNHYLSQFDRDLYEANRIKFLHIVKVEYSVFLNTLKLFCQL